MAPALVLFFIRIIANQNTLQHGQRRLGQLVHDQKDHASASTSTSTWASSARPFSIRSIWPPTSASCCSSSCPSSCTRPASACVCAPAAKIRRRRTRWASTSTRCATPARPSPARWRGMGGFVYALTTANCSSNGDVAGFGFLALAVMIFGNWKPLNIAGRVAAVRPVQVHRRGLRQHRHQRRRRVSCWRRSASARTSTGCCRTSSRCIVLAFTSKKLPRPQGRGHPLRQGQPLSQATVPLRTCRASGRCVPFCKWNAEIPFEAGSAPSSTPCGSDIRQAAAASRALAGQA